MSAITKVVLPVLRQAGVRHGHTVATPPRVKVSFAEKMCHAAAIVVGVTFIPVWVIAHLDDYKHKK